MQVAIIVLSISTILLLFYAVFMRLQVHRINKQLGNRLKKRTNQSIRIELFDSELNELVENINCSFEAEETLRHKIVQEEKEFKEMIANISHDLRTPLTTIKGYLQLLSKSELEDEQERKLSIARKHVEELGELIEHFFEYAYLLDAKPQVDFERVNLTNAIMECLAAVVPMLEERGLQLHVEETQVFVKGNREWIMRVLQNLLRNCLSHAREHINIQFEKGETVILHIRNPIDKSSELEVSKLFKRFYVGDKARTSTGLGLSIVKLLMEQMGGTVKASMKDGNLDIMVEFM